eukprot:1161471-Pelagomonas_calceolata.AAC.2
MTAGSPAPLLNPSAYITHVQSSDWTLKGNTAYKICQVLHIISLMAPANVPQCVSYGEPEAYPDILPALLESDPSTWPDPPPTIPPADNAQ